MVSAGDQTTPALVRRAVMRGASGQLSFRNGGRRDLISISPALLQGIRAIAISASRRGGSPCARASHIRKPLTPHSHNLFKHLNRHWQTSVRPASVRPMLKGKAKARYMRGYMRRWRAQRPAKPPEPTKPSEPKGGDNLSNVRPALSDLRQRPHPGPSRPNLVPLQGLGHRG